MRKPPKIDQRAIERAKELRGKGWTQAEIAVELGVSQGTVSVILRMSGLGGKLVRQPSPLTLLRRKA